MNIKIRLNIQKQLIDFALASFKAKMKLLPSLERHQIYSMIIRDILDKYLEHGEELSQISIYEIADREYDITVNHSIKVSMLIRKEDSP